MHVKISMIGNGGADRGAEGATGVDHDEAAANAGPWGGIGVEHEEAVIVAFWSMCGQSTFEANSKPAEEH